jgi:hypothetical protein
MKRVQGWQLAAVAVALWCSVSFTFDRVIAAAADNARIEGVAMDARGTAIGQAAVTLKPSSGAEKRAVADAKGVFSFQGLAAGTYAITVDAPGFQRTRYTNITLTDNQTRKFDFALRSGAVSETVEIDITRPTTLVETQPRFSFDGTPLPSSGPGTISGRIRTAAGASASGIAVGAIAADSRFSGLPSQTAFHTRADTLGFYRLDNLPVGRYFIVAGTEALTGGGFRIDRPIYFPGVADLSRAVSVSAGLGREETADFRLDDPLTFPVFTPRSGVFRLSGRLVNQSVIAFDRQPIAWRQLRVTLEPSASLSIQSFGGGGRGAPVRAGCRPPAQASFSSAVDSDGRFSFSVASGVYDLCVFGAGGAPRGGGASSGAAWNAVVGPFSVVVDRDIESLLVDIGRR